MVGIFTANGYITGTEGFPFCNIIRVDDNKYYLELAVAGFAPEDLSVTVDPSNRRLVVRSTEKESEVKDYLHRGISNKSFAKVFALKEFIEVTGSSLKNGILRIDLEVIVPEEKKPISIKIAHD